MRNDTHTVNEKTPGCEPGVFFLRGRVWDLSVKTSGALSFDFLDADDDNSFFFLGFAANDCNGSREGTEQTKARGGETKHVEFRDCAR
ncbi:MAG: hypothetical protein ACI8RZ_002693 [Myxococcota bacterium]|jgi:hypothetical protein